MNNKASQIQKIASVKELHRLMDLPEPANPFITFIDHAQPNLFYGTNGRKIILELYNISIKRSFRGQLKYGKHTYDFDNGTLSFVAPNQIISVDAAADKNQDGWSLLFHPDLIRQYALGKAIKQYGFFSYSVNEALHLSDEEEKTIESLVQNIRKEIDARIDHFSQDVIVSNLDLLLSYSNRFYSRQFITRKMASNDLLTQFDDLLDTYFSDNADMALPTVEKLAAQLHVSSAYLSDMLRNLTGQNTQQHIHNRLIEKAKEVLTTTELTVGEIAYQLGFGYPQSFSKLFKTKTNLSPLEYRRMFN